MIIGCDKKCSNKRCIRNKVFTMQNWFGPTISPNLKECEYYKHIMVEDTTEPIWEEEKLNKLKEKLKRPKKNVKLSN